MDISEGANILIKNDLQENNKNELENNHKFTSNTVWSDNDKRILLKALKKYGSGNITAISKMLPTISPRAIKIKILEYSTVAEALLENELLDNWLKCGSYQPQDSFIPEALLFIHLFEEHPLPSESEGYDFREIYNFLHRSCFEQTSFFDLSEKDRSLLCTCLSRIEKKIWPISQKDIWEYVGRVYSKRNIKKVYQRKNINSL